ncbi:hypothetical protein EH233_07255 [Anabaena sp. YBS01]|nr:hypothetical protein EH233_07255 [Anabaena sp. YBS01]
MPVATTGGTPTDSSLKSGNPPTQLSSATRWLMNRVKTRFIASLQMVYFMRVTQFLRKTGFFLLHDIK